MRPLLAVPLLALAVLLAAPATAQPLDGVRATIKRVYNLSASDDGPAVGALRRTEVETYDVGGRRLRVEWRDPGGAVTLAFMELYAAADRPYGAVYFEGDLEPNLERNEYLDDGRLKRVTYTDAAGAVTAVNEFVLDAEGRELERRYGAADGSLRGTDTVRWDDDGNQAGYVYARADGSRRVEYTYDYQSFDARGAWTSRVVRRDGEPRMLEVRELHYADAP